MLVDLKSIDEEGKDYNFDELSDEMKGVFVDLIGETPFKIDVEIRPLGNTYQVQGSVSSQYKEVCSRCGYEIDVPLSSRINEIVVIEKQRPRNTQVSQSRQNLEGPSVTYVNEPSLDLKEFLHEMMASGFNIYPTCADTSLCESRQHRDPMIQEEKKPVGHPGFAALKDIKVTKH